MVVFIAALFALVLSAFMSVFCLLVLVLCHLSVHFVVVVAVVSVEFVNAGC